MEVTLDIYLDYMKYKGFLIFGSTYINRLYGSFQSIDCAGFSIEYWLL